MAKEKIALFDKVDQLLLVGKIDSALDEVFNTIDGLLLAGKFLEVDYIVEHVDLNTDLNILIGYLTITFAAKSKLKNRADFFNKVKEMYKDREKGLFWGLE